MVPSFIASYTELNLLLYDFLTNIYFFLDIRVLKLLQSELILPEHDATLWTRSRLSDEH